MLAEMFRATLLTSAVGSALAIILILLKPVTERVFGAKWNYYIWLAVLVVMILPVSIKLPEKAPVMEQTEEVSLVTAENAMEPTFQTVAPTPAQTPEIEIPTIVGVLPQNVLDTASVIWLFGVIVLLLFKTIRYFLFLRVVYKNANPTDICMENADRLRVRKTSMIDAPLIIGLVRPILLLPDGVVEEGNLQYIFAHELIHYKRHDILYKWFVMLVNCVHWFNPLMYVISEQIDEECEISCDLAATQNMDSNEKNNYMKLILDLLAKSKGKGRLLTTQMASGKKILKRRFTMIQKMRRTSKVITVVSIVVTLVIVTLAVFASGILQNSVRDKTQSNNHIENLKVDPIVGNRTHFLMAGVDNSQMRVDTLMLVSLDKKDKNVTVLSIPRDTAVTIDGELYKISTSMEQEGGDQKVIDAVRNNLGIPVNYYVRINFESLRNIVDTLGGVAFNVPVDMHYEDPYQDLTINLSKGEQVLSGEQAEGLLRYRRGYAKGDIDRIQVQQDFLKELIKQKYNTSDITKLKDGYDELSKNIVTNIPVADLLKYRDAKVDNIKMVTVPGETEEINGMYFYQMDGEKLEEMLK